jgi:hypothetical protein
VLDFQFLCSYYVLMGKGKWTRWGRGNCEGYGLEIGNALRASVFRNSDGFWETSINAVDHGNFENIEDAKTRIEEAIRDDVSLILEDWELWNNAKMRAA